MRGNMRPACRAQGAGCYQGVPGQAELPTLSSRVRRATPRPTGPCEGGRTPGLRHSLEVAARQGTAKRPLPTRCTSARSSWISRYPASCSLKVFSTSKLHAFARCIFFGTGPTTAAAPVHVLSFEQAGGGVEAVDWLLRVDAINTGAGRLRKAAPVAATSRAAMGLAQSRPRRRLRWGRVWYGRTGSEVVAVLSGGRQLAVSAPNIIFCFSRSRGGIRPVRSSLTEIPRCGDAG